MVPTKQRLAAVSLCSVTMMCMLVSVIPRATGGRLGIIAVSGDSMAALPYASRVVVLPLRARPGDYVTAWGSLDHPEAEEDRRPTLLVKLYDGQRLVSTATCQTCSRFELRGRVVGLLPVQKILPRLSRRSSVTPSPLFKPRTPAEQLRVLRLALVRQRHVQRFLASGDARWHALDHTTLAGCTSQTRVVKLPEPCRRIALCVDTGPEAEVLVCAGQQVVARCLTSGSEVQTVAAPVGQRLDRLVLALRPSTGGEQHATLVAVRPVAAEASQYACRP